MRSVRNGKRTVFESWDWPIELYVNVVRPLLAPKLGVASDRRIAPIAVR